MAMHNPPHPGEFINAVYLEPNDISGRELAANWVALPRAGWPCSTAMICGRPSVTSICAALRRSKYGCSPAPQSRLH
jgi:plasmid maintenance system antidote protein VapI